MDTTLVARNMRIFNIIDTIIAFIAEINRSILIVNYWGFDSRISISIIYIFLLMLSPSEIVLKTQPKYLLILLTVLWSSVTKMPTLSF